MEHNVINSFEKIIKSGLYKEVRESKRIIIRESDYELKIRLYSEDGDGIAFRIEDFKAEANYLAGEHSLRGGGKDNDLTFLDNGTIYQFEVKKTKTPNSMLGKQQLTKGMSWVKHILNVALPNYNNYFNKIAYIQISIPKRVSLGRKPKSFEYVLKKDGIIILLSSNVIKTIDLKNLSHYLKNERRVMDLDWKQF